MRQLATECDFSPLWVLHALATRTYDDVEHLLTLPHHYCVEEGGIARSPHNQQVVKTRLKFRPLKWMFKHSKHKYRIIRAAVYGLAIEIFADRIHCCMHSPGGPDEWYFELSLDVSSPKNRALYRVRSYSRHETHLSHRSRLSLEIDIFADDIDEKVVDSVKMVDQALDELFTKCVAHARKY